MGVVVSARRTGKESTLTYFCVRKTGKAKEEEEEIEDASHQARVFGFVCFL